MMWSNKLTCWVAGRNTVFGEKASIQPRPSGVEGGEREGEEKREKNSKAEQKPLEINNWRHSFYVQAQQRWLLKCHLGRNIEMKETPQYKLLKECVIVSEVVRAGGELRLSFLTLAELPSRDWLLQRWKLCSGLWGVQTPHCLNTCKICQKYRFIMTPHKTEVRPAVCKTSRYSGIHQVNQPFIMYAGSWRAGITFIFRALYCANEKEGTGQLHKSGGLVWCHYSFISWT